jgi:hypothetical protein
MTTTLYIFIFVVLLHLNLTTILFVYNNEHNGPKYLLHYYCCIIVIVVVLLQLNLTTIIFVSENEYNGPNYYYIVIVVLYLLPLYYYI